MQRPFIQFHCVCLGQFLRLDGQREPIYSAINPNVVGGAVKHKLEGRGFWVT